MNPLDKPSKYKHRLRTTSPLLINNTLKIASMKVKILADQLKGLLIRKLLDESLVHNFSCQSKV